MRSLPQRYRCAAAPLAAVPVPAAACPCCHSPALAAPGADVHVSNQDQWWLSGLHRGVFLLAKPAVLAICDYHYRFVSADSDSEDAFELEVRLEGTAARQLAAGAGYRVKMSLHGPFILEPGEPPPPACTAEVWCTTAEVRACDDEHSDVDAATHDGDGAQLLCGPAVATMRVEMGKSARLWTAETPHLYTLLLQARNTPHVPMPRASSSVPRTCTRL